MKILKYAYMPLLLFMVLIFCVPAYATTSQTSTSFTDKNSNTISIRGQTYTNIYPDDVEYSEVTTDHAQNIITKNTYHLSENISFSGLSSSLYYSGFIYFKITASGSVTGTEIRNWVMENQTQNDGINCGIGFIGNNYAQVYVFFDNYKITAGTLIGINTITFDAIYASSNATSTPSVTQNVNVTLSVISSNLTGYEGVQNNALTAMIYSAVSQATAPELESILSMLTDIRNQDYTYYVQLTSQLASVLSNQTTELQRLQSILNELDTDFEDVQTILDLFPSYRTQVLEYWQQLLEMNSDQSSAAADMESEYADKNDQSSNLLSGLGNITYPSISAGDVDIMSNVDSDTKTNFFGMLSLITNNSLITTILLIVITGMIVGYILYGKR